MICQRCAKDVRYNPIHTCTPSPLVRELMDKAELFDKYEFVLGKIMPPDFKDWWENAIEEHPEVAAACFVSARAEGDLWLSQLELLRNENEALQSRIHEAVEVFAGMEGVPVAETACEGYLLRIIDQMMAALRGEAEV
jgi:hypothetical protein